MRDEGGVFRLFTCAFQNLINAHAMHTRLSNSHPHSPSESLGTRLARVPLCVLILEVSTRKVPLFLLHIACYLNFSSFCVMQQNFDVNLVERYKITIDYRLNGR